jgi:lysozyme
VSFRFRTTASVVIAVALALLLILLLGLIRRNDPSPEFYPVTGIDISHHQGPIDWEAVAASGIDFAFMKATEGRDFSDPRFEFNWQQAREAGVARGAYHFFTFCSPGLDQARHFLSVVPPEAAALLPAADVEFAGNCSGYGDLEQVRRELEIFLAEVERGWGRKPILYLTFRSKVQIADARFDEYPVWLRNVFWRLPNDAAGFWTLWQYSDDGEVPGVVGPVDRNVLHPDVSVESLRVGS